MESLYDELFRLWESKFGAYPLGVVGKNYLVCDFNNSYFEVFECRRDLRCSCGYKYFCFFRGSFEDVVSKYGL